MGCWFAWGSLHFFRPIFLAESLILRSFWIAKKRVSEGRFSGQKQFFHRFRGPALGC